MFCILFTILILKSCEKTTLKNFKHKYAMITFKYIIQLWYIHYLYKCYVLAMCSIIKKTYKKNLHKNNAMIRTKYPTCNKLTTYLYNKITFLVILI